MNKPNLKKKIYLSIINPEISIDLRKLQNKCHFKLNLTNKSYT